MSFSVFEALMIVCFGAAWPFSIWKSYKSRSNKGKSIIFICVVCIGYFCGIIHKVFWSFDLVIILYVVNFILVVVDIAFYLRNQQFQKPVVPS